ncbi:RagB/SusD family nutrient uptake outer membrane protein [Reichenbachiella sp. MALMAid0571]|uniref:RagB/SusD family nutrient uptake outer membrane protein n=1 Tax=Reichenbachiella sp. MALMAid0571 TaxID=3143939 RepID=UPI0032DF8041
MKILSRHIYIIALVLIFVSTLSCNEQAFLEEKPESFFVLETAYQNFEQFESALYDLYARLRATTYGGGGISANWAMFQWTGTDAFYNGRFDNSTSRFADYQQVYIDGFGYVSDLWRNYYKIVTNANTLLDRLQGSELTANEKSLIEAEAKFFRAFAYRYLVYHYGGVPLVINEITGPTTDFTRASKQDILNQMVTDFTDAANNLPGITEVQDGRLHNLVAQHYLAETHIALGQWNEAITAASVVINDPNTGLMTERFGSLASDDRGNPYWDLFRLGNQNRSTGNTEAIWVAQMETDIQGGFLLTGGGAGINPFEGYHASLIWIQLDPDGNPATLGPRSTFNVGGRGINLLSMTEWVEQELWGADYDIDERSLNINLWRDYYYDNPESPYFMESFADFPPEPTHPFAIQPYLTKVTVAGQHPESLYANKETLVLSSGAGSTYRDQYYVRLPETYLLRAEAYVGLGDNSSAAADVNVIRARSSATLALASEVDLDYILDERVRELSLEEPRRLTLHRTGKLVERVRAHNPFNADDIQDHHSLMPIPLSDIEANIDAVLEQNPGYGGAN